MIFMGNIHMNIYGFDKTSLLNYPGHVAATVFTGGCNMRCPYCHNSELVLDPPADMKIPEEEVLAHLKKRSNVLSGLCITGGEPTLQPDLRDFIIKVRALGYKIKLDTNGLKPDTLKGLLDEGLLDYVAMDIKAGRENYGRTTGIASEPNEAVETAGHSADSGYIDRISESVRILTGSDIDYDFRTTVVKGLHTADDFTDIRDWLAEIIDESGNGIRVRHYYLQSYVYRDTVLDKSGDYDSFTKEELENLAGILEPIAEKVMLRGIE